MTKYLIASLLFTSPCFASDSYKELAAEYEIGGATVVDAPASEPTKTHIYLRIKDDAAQDMYNIMDSAPVPNECLDDGTLTKWAKNIQCDFNPNNGAYVCYFSVDVNSNAIGLGVAC